jgi:hypothetical protein
MKLSKDLEELFEFVSPDELRKSIQEIYFSYIDGTPDLHRDFKEISSNIYFLINFLEKAHTMSFSKIAIR